MTLPRRLLPRLVQSLTRRCKERRLYLKPTPEVTQIVLYCLGRALEGRNVALLAFLANTNHFHMVVCDLSESGEPSDLSGFMGHFDSLVARALNTHYGTGESFWAPGSYRNVEVWTEASLESQLLYLWTNPVRDGLVAHPDDWPGAKTTPEDFGTTITVTKPKGAFFGGRGKAKRAPTDPQALQHWQAELAREEQEAVDRGRERDAKKTRKGKGPSSRRRRQLDEERARKVRKGREPDPKRRDRSTLPETVEIKVHRPPGYDHLSLEELRVYFREELEEETRSVHAQRAAQGKRSFMGIEGVLAQDPRASAGPVWPTFERIPRVACKGDTELRIQVLLGLQAWRARYRRAWVAYDDPDAEDLPFPEGTLLMFRRHGVELELGTGPPLRLAA